MAYRKLLQTLLNLCQQLQLPNPVWKPVYPLLDERISTMRILSCCDFTPFSGHFDIPAHWEKSQRILRPLLLPPLPYQLPIYRHDTIGRAKQHLEGTAKELDTQLQAELNGRSLISVNKALVTQASAAIPVVPLYISLLYKVMKEKGIHEGAIEQIHRLFGERLYGESDIPTDEEGRIRGVLKTP